VVIGCVEEELDVMAIDMSNGGVALIPCKNEKATCSQQTRFALYLYTKSCNTLEGYHTI
jgi:hypothetical protein